MYDRLLLSVSGWSCDANSNLGADDSTPRLCYLGVKSASYELIIGCYCAENTQISVGHFLRGSGGFSRCSGGGAVLCPQNLTLPYLPPACIPTPWLEELVRAGCRRLWCSAAAARVSCSTRSAWSAGRCTACCCRTWPPQEARRAWPTCAARCSTARPRLRCVGAATVHAQSLALLASRLASALVHALPLSVHTTPPSACPGIQRKCMQASDGDIACLLSLLHVQSPYCWHGAAQICCTRTMAAAAYTVLEGRRQSSEDMQSTATFRMLKAFFAVRPFACARSHS